MVAYAGNRNGLDITSAGVQVTVASPGLEEYLYAAEQTAPTASADFYVREDDSLAGDYDTLVAAARTMVDCANAADLAFNGDLLVLRLAEGVLTLYRGATPYWDHPGVLERIPQPYRFSDERIIY